MPRSGIAHQRFAKGLELNEEIKTGNGSNRGNESLERRPLSSVRRESGHGPFRLDGSGRAHPWRVLSPFQLKGPNCGGSLCYHGRSVSRATGASASKKSPQSGLKTIASTYLSAAHRDDPSDGCPLAALGSEMARADEATRAAATEAFLKLPRMGRPTGS